MADADRERLIEILKFDPCPSPYLCDENCKYANLKSCYEERTADLLLEHGVIVPPCKVGDTVWWVNAIVDENCEEKPDILLGEIASFSVQKEGLWAFCRYVGGLTFWHLVSDYFGKTVFLTREGAERALKEREDNG